MLYTSQPLFGGPNFTYGVRTLPFPVIHIMHATTSQLCARLTLITLCRETAGLVITIRNYSILVNYEPTIYCPQEKMVHFISSHNLIE